jgi:hypothetical protein
MRVLYGAIMGGGKAPKMSSGPSYAEQKAKEDAASDEAKRKARADASNRQGARASLLTNPELGTEFGANSTRRKTLFGG